MSSFSEKIKKHSRLLILLVVVYVLFLVVIWGGGALYENSQVNKNTSFTQLDEPPEEPIAEMSGAAQVASDWIDVLQKFATFLGLIPGIVIAWKKMFTKTEV